MIVGWMKRIFGYISFAVLIALICLWLGFPYTAYVNARLAKMESPPVRVRVGQAEPLLPLGLEVQDVDLICLRVPGLPTVGIEELGCRISPLSFVRKAWDASWQGRVFGGTLDGEGRLSPMNRPDTFDGRLSFDGVGLQGVLGCMGILEGASGETSGGIVFRGSLGRIARGTGNATVGVDRVAFGLETPLSGKITVANGEGDVVVRMEKGRVEIVSCAFSCKGMRGTVSGNILLRHPLARSGLKLIVSLTPDGAVAEQFPAASLVMRPGTTYKVSLSGSLGKPMVKLLG
ncbi:type II secretion system protein GspN [Desulfoplanes sp.]